MLDGLLESVIMWEKNFGCSEDLRSRDLRRIPSFYARFDLRKGIAYIKPSVRHHFNTPIHDLQLAISKGKRVPDHFYE